MSALARYEGNVYVAPEHQHASCLSTRIKDAGIAIRHSRGYIISILQGLETGWGGWAGLPPYKMIQFIIEITKIKVSSKS